EPTTGNADPLSRREQSLVERAPALGAGADTHPGGASSRIEREMRRGVHAWDRAPRGDDSRAGRSRLAVNRHSDPVRSRRRPAEAVRSPGGEEAHREARDDGDQGCVGRVQPSPHGASFGPGGAAPPPAKPSYPFSTL